MDLFLGIVVFCFIIFTALIIVILHFIRKDVRDTQYSFQCYVDQCATNLSDGSKRCPENIGQAISYDPRFERCENPFSCSSGLAEKTDGSTDASGICENGVTCRCVREPSCPDYISIPFTNNDYFQLYNSNKVDYCTIGGFSVSNIINAPPICKNLNVKDRIDCLSLNLCLKGKMSYITQGINSYETFKLDNNTFGTEIGCINDDYFESKVYISPSDSWWQNVCKDFPMDSSSWKTAIDNDIHKDFLWLSYKCGNKTAFSGPEPPPDTIGDVGSYYIGFYNNEYSIYGPKNSNGWSNVKLFLNKRVDNKVNLVYDFDGSLLHIGNIGEWLIDPIRMKIWGPKTPQGWGLSSSYGFQVLVYDDNVSPPPTPSEYYFYFRIIKSPTQITIRGPLPSNTPEENIIPVPATSYSNIILGMSPPPLHSISDAIYIDPITKVYYYDVLGRWDNRQFYGSGSIGVNTIKRYTPYPIFEKESRKIYFKLE